MPIINYIGKNMKTYDVKPHKHNFWEIIYCTNGSGKIIFENAKPLEYSQNEIVVIPPNIVHSNTSQVGRPISKTPSSSRTISKKICLRQ